MDNFDQLPPQTDVAPPPLDCPFCNFLPECQASRDKGELTMCESHDLRHLLGSIIDKEIRE